MTERIRTEMARPILVLDGVGKRFGGVMALGDVHFSVMPGTVHAICGENGAGKSTLMKILAGVIGDYTGSITLDGRPIRFASTRDAERAGLSIIHQELNLVGPLSVAANIFLGRERTRWGGLIRDDAGMHRAAQCLLDELESPLDPQTPVSRLRIGDQQLVEIAKALSLDARIVIMDEPTSALTDHEVERLDRIITTLRSRGVTVLYISHKMEEIFRWADRITILRDGRHVWTRPRSEVTPSDVTAAMVGRTLPPPTDRSDATEREVVLAVRDLGLPWPGHPRAHRLRGISFDVRAGEVLGLAGLMGAGRTELLECLYGANSVPFSGEIRLGENPIRFSHPREAIDAGVALVTEDRKTLGLVGPMNVRENTTLSALSRWATVGIVPPWSERSAIGAVMERLRIKCASPEAPIGSLSGGNQQKCLIGRTLLTSPRLLLLDDPTRGIDIGAKTELYALIDQLRDEGIAIVVTSSELPELLRLADRILVLAEGVPTGEFSRANATEEAIMAAATATTFDAAKAYLAATLSLSDA